MWLCCSSFVLNSHLGDALRLFGVVQFFSHGTSVEAGEMNTRSQGKGGSGEGQLDQVTLRSFNLEHKKTNAIENFLGGNSS